MLQCTVDDESRVCADYADLANFFRVDRPVASVAQYLHSRKILNDPNHARELLRQALLQKNLAVVRNLVKLQLPWLSHVSDDTLAINVALKRNFIKACKVFFDYFSIERSPLVDVEHHYLIALKLGYLEAVKRFLRHEPMLDLTATTTPVKIAVDESNAELLDLLLEHDCPVNYRDAEGASHLHRICKRLAADVEPVQFLPILKTLKVLLMHRWMAQHELKARCNTGKTPILHLLDRSDIKYKETLKNQLVVLKELVRADKGVVKHRHSITHETALHYACDESRFAYFPKNEEGAEIVRYLLRHGADPNAQDQYNKTPLEDAVCSLNPRSVQALLEAGAEVHPDELLLDFGHFGGQRKARRLLPTMEVTQNLMSIVAALDKHADYQFGPAQYAPVLNFLNDWYLEIDAADIHDPATKAKVWTLLLSGPPESIYQFFISHWMETKFDQDWKRLLHTIVWEYLVIFRHNFYRDNQLWRFLHNIVKETRQQDHFHFANTCREFRERLYDEIVQAKVTQLMNDATVDCILNAPPEKLRRHLKPTPRRVWLKRLYSFEFKHKFPILHKVILGRINRCVIDDYTRSSCLEVLLQMGRAKIPILCCEKIIRELKVGDMLNMCEAAADYCLEDGARKRDEPKTYDYEGFVGLLDLVNELPKF